MEKELGKETESSEANKVYIKREDRCGGRTGSLGGGGGQVSETETERKSKRGGEHHVLVLLRWFKSLVGGSPFRLLSANHLVSSGLEPILGLTQGPPLHAHISFSQDGF